MPKSRRAHFVGSVGTIDGVWIHARLVRGGTVGGVFLSVVESGEEMMESCSR